MTKATNYTFINSYINKPKCIFTIKIEYEHEQNKKNHIEFINTNNDTELLSDYNFIKLKKSYTVNFLKSYIFLQNK